MRSCKYSEQRHKVGELCHYFDHIWVITRAVKDECLICKRVKEAEFVPSRYCPGVSDKDANDNFLTLMKKRWFACRVELGSQTNVKTFLTALQ